MAYLCFRTDFLAERVDCRCGVPRVVRFRALSTARSQPIAGFEGLMPRSRWVPRMIVIMIALVGVAWLWKGGGFAVVMGVIFAAALILGLTPITSRRKT